MSVSAVASTPAGSRTRMPAGAPRLVLVGGPAQPPRPGEPGWFEVWQDPSSWELPRGSSRRQPTSWLICRLRSAARHREGAGPSGPDVTTAPARLRLV